MYTFVGARAPTMLSWAPPQGALGTHNQSWYRYWHHCYGSLTRAQGRDLSVTTTVLAASLNLDAFTLEAGWEHGREVGHAHHAPPSVDRLLHGIPMTFFVCSFALHTYAFGTAVRL